jgi:hypothetical protein
MNKRKREKVAAAKSNGAVAPSPSKERALLVAVELGGEWPAGFEAGKVGVRRVLTQEEGEPPLAFAERVVGEVENAVSRGVTFSLAAVACNERADDVAIDARRRLARSLLGSMAGSKTGTVYLTASARTSGRLRHALSTLASELAAEWATAGVETSVRFGDESRSAPRNSLEHVPARVA